MIVFLYILFIIDLKFATLNLNGARDIKKRSQLFQLMKMKHVDVFFAQETHSDTINEVNWKREWEGMAIFSHKNSTSAGVGVFFAKNCLPISYDVEEIVEGRLLKVNAKFDVATFVLINVYAPVMAAERLLFLETLLNTVQNCDPDHYLLIAGDFNCTAMDIDRNHREPHTASRLSLNRCIETNDLVDVWRNLNSKTKQYTWVQIRERVVSMARLDKLYCFKHQVQIVKSCCISPVGFSDHSMVLASVFIKFLKVKSAYWIFNSALLQDLHFKKCFEFFWKEWKNKKAMFSSVQQWWDLGKKQIQQLCVQYNFNVTQNMSKNYRKTS